MPAPVLRDDRHQDHAPDACLEILRRQAGQRQRSAANDRSEAYAARCRALINGVSAPAPGAPRGVGAARPTRDGGLGHSAHLNNACGLLHKAREPLSLAAERIADSKRLLELYLKGTVGSVTTSLPKTEKSHRKDRKETKEATKDAKVVAKEIAEANEEAKKFSRKLKDPEELPSTDDLPEKPDSGGRDVRGS